MRHDRAAGRHHARAWSFCAASAAGRSRWRRAPFRARSWSSPCAIPAAAAISPASRTASSARTCSMPTTPPATGSRPRGLHSRPSAGAAVERIWVIEPGVGDGELWCGVAPAALFRSGDNGKTWALVRGTVERADAAAMGARRRRPVPALDLSLARRSQAPGDRHLGRRRLAHRRWRQELAARRRRPGAALPARGGAQGRAHASASTT